MNFSIQKKNCQIQWNLYNGQHWNLKECPLQRGVCFIVVLLKLALQIPAPKCIGTVHPYSPIGLLLLKLVSKYIKIFIFSWLKEYLQTDKYQSPIRLLIQKKHKKKPLQRSQCRVAQHYYACPQFYKGVNTVKTYINCC